MAFSFLLLICFHLLIAFGQLLFLDFFFRSPLYTSMTSFCCCLLAFAIIDGLTHWMTDWAEWLSHWLIDWPIHWLISWLDGRADWLTHWTTDWLDWLIDRYRYTNTMESYITCLINSITISWFIMHNLRTRKLETTVLTLPGGTANTTSKHIGINTNCSIPFHNEHT